MGARGLRRAAARALRAPPKRFGSRLAGEEHAQEIEEQTDAYRRLRIEVLDAERETLVEMRSTGEITEEVMRTVEHDLDLEQRRLET